MNHWKEIQVKGETEGAGRSLNLSSQSLGGSREICSKSHQVAWSTTLII